MNKQALMPRTHSHRPAIGRTQSALIRLQLYSCISTEQPTSMAETISEKSADADDDSDTVKPELSKGEGSRRLHLKTVGVIAKAPTRESPQPLKRTLTVLMVEVNRLSDIDIINQRFRAEVVVQMAFEGCAKDEDLNSQNPGFPFDAWGRPTFRPSALWYMAQVDFNNAHEYKTLDAKVMPSGDDLMMNLRFEGVFSEISTLLPATPSALPNAAFPFFVTATRMTSCVQWSSSPSLATYRT